jgi:hypothetical protein
MALLLASGSPYQPTEWQHIGDAGAATLSAMSLSPVVSDAPPEQQVLTAMSVPPLDQVHPAMPVSVATSLAHAPGPLRN